MASRRRNGPDRKPALQAEHYRNLARFRYALRKFLRFSENAAREARVSPGQYQLLLFVKDFPAPGPTVSDLAERLQIRHQSAVGLIDRCMRSGLVRRQRDSNDGRRVRVQLTRNGTRLLARLVLEHYRGLAELGAAMPRPLSTRVSPG
ncbi:MAG TPA: MarR family transcriptional regulator [Thermoanaerobaculia bacterium]